MADEHIPMPGHPPSSAGRRPPRRKKPAAGRPPSKRTGPRPKAPGAVRPVKPGVSAPAGQGEARKRPAKPGTAPRPVRKKAVRAKKPPEGVRPKKRRRRRKGRMTLYYILFGIVGAIVFSVLSYTVFFRVYQITVSGEIQRYSKEEITKCSGLEMGRSLFGIDQREISAKVSTVMPYVESIQVKLHFPTEVELIVKEAQPVSAVQVGTGYIYISDQGKVLESGLSEYLPSVPLLVGLTPSSSEVGTYPFSQFTEQMQILRELNMAIQSSELRNVTVISLADRLNLRLLVEERLLVELGTENNLEWKLRFVRQALEENMDRTMTGVFDVSLIEEDNRGYYYDAKDLRTLILEETQQAVTEGGQMPGMSIQVDPETGVVVVGPHKSADTSSSSSPEDSSSSEASKDDADISGSESEESGSVLE